MINVVNSSAVLNVTIINEMCNFSLSFDEETTKYLNYYYFTVEFTTSKTYTHAGRIDFETAVRKPIFINFINENSTSNVFNIMGF